MYCTKCGAKLADGQRFCTSCGTPTKAAQQPAPASQQPVPDSPSDPAIGNQPTADTELAAAEEQKAQTEPGAHIDLQPAPTSQPSTPASEKATQPATAETATPDLSGQLSDQKPETSGPIQPAVLQTESAPPVMPIPSPPEEAGTPAPEQEVSAASARPGPQGSRGGHLWIWMTVAALVVIAVAVGGYFGFKSYYGSAPQQNVSPATGGAVQSDASNTPQAGQGTSPNTVATPDTSQATVQGSQNNMAASPGKPATGGTEQSIVHAPARGRRTVAENQFSPAARKEAPPMGSGSAAGQEAPARSGEAPDVSPPPVAQSQPSAPAAQPVLPPVASLRADSASIIAGQSVTLKWETQNARDVSIQPGVGSVPARGSVTVQPTMPTTYTLTATGPQSSVTSSAKVDVSPPGPSEGTVVWQGEVHGVSPVSIEGNHSSIGTIVSGSLPGLPCTVRLVNSKQATLQTTPEKWNSWKLIVLQVKGRGNVTVRIDWTLLR